MDKIKEKCPQYCNCKYSFMDTSIEMEDGKMWISVMDCCAFNVEINFCPICGKCLSVDGVPNE